MTKPATLAGYIIARRDLNDRDALMMGRSTFGRTPYQAWLRHLGPQEHAIEPATVKIARWSEKGYGPRKAMLTIISENPK